jgi:hypothetical protein
LRHQGGVFFVGLLLSFEESSVLRYRLKKVVPLLVGAVTLLLTLAVVEAVVFTGDSSAITPLGNASALRQATAQPMHPQGHNEAVQLRPGTAEPVASAAAEADNVNPPANDTDSAGANASTQSATHSESPSGASSAASNTSAPIRTYGADDQQARQQAILAAYNCARTPLHLPPLTLDPTLSRKAEASWIALHSGSRQLESLGQSYPLFNLVAFDDSVPAQGCAFGGFDPTIAPALSQANTIGIAAFPSQDDEAQDSPSALIIGK